MVDIESMGVEMHNQGQKGSEKSSGAGSGSDRKTTPPGPKDFGKGNVSGRPGVALPTTATGGHGKPR